MRLDRQKGHIISKCEKITVTNELCVFNQIKMKICHIQIDYFKFLDYNNFYDFLSCIKL